MNNKSRVIRQSKDCFYLDEVAFTELFRAFKENYKNAYISVTFTGDFISQYENIDDFINLQNTNSEKIINVSFRDRDTMDSLTFSIDSSYRTIELCLSGEEAKLRFFVSKIDNTIKDSRQWWWIIEKYSHLIGIILTIVIAALMSGAMLIIYENINMISDQNLSSKVENLVFFGSFLLALFVIGFFFEKTMPLMLPKNVFCIGKQKQYFNTGNNIRNTVAVTAILAVLGSILNYLGLIF